MKKLITALLAVAMIATMFAGCGSTSTSSAAASETASAATEASAAEEAPAEEEETAEPAAEEAEAPAAEESASAEEAAPAEEAETDFTAANAAMDFTGYKEMLNGLTTELPISDGTVTLSYFFGFEGSTLNYLPDGTMNSHQVWQWVQENMGVNFDLQVVDKTQETDQFNLIVASGDYPDIMPANDYSGGVEAAVEDEVFIDLTDLMEENMPNYYTIVNSDKNLLDNAQDGDDQFMAIYAIKDQVANPSGVGPFIRQDWLDDLGMEVPQTYDELTEVLKAFKSEKGASEPLALFNTINFTNGVLMGGFGSIAELSSNGMGTDWSASFYQEDGTVIFGATADGTRKYLSWLNELYNEGLINFETMQNRETNPFSDYNAGMASNGTNGYIITNQPFGGEYSKMAASSGDENCNWWPCQDVAETAGQTINFYEEVNLIDQTALAITTACEEPEIALQVLDYGYSYNGSLLYNFGFQKGDDAGQYQTWDYNTEGEPEFDEAALAEVSDTTNIASGVVCTKDLAGIVFDNRLAFSFGDRELACFDAWKTNKNTNNILGSSTVLNADEATEASSIYSDIITYVATSALQFINGDMDVNGDDWDNYVATIDSMDIASLTEIVQGAYDRAHS